MNYFSQDDILNITSDLLIFVNSKGNIVKINNAVEKLTNFSENDLLKQNINILFKNKSLLDKYINENNFSNTQFLNIELQLKKKNKTIIIVSSSINIIRNNDIIKGYIFLCKNLTNKIKNEDELRQYKNNIEELVNEQTKNITIINENLKNEISERKEIEINLKKKNKEVYLINEKLNNALKDLTASNEEYETQNEELISSHEELIINEEKFRHIIDLIPYPIIIFEGNKLIFSNKKAVNTFGYTMDEVKDMETWLNLAYPDKNYREYVLKTWMNSIAKHMKDKIHLEPLEYEVTHKNGNKMNVEFHTILLEKILYIVMNDLTDIKKTNSLMIQSEKMMTIGGLAAGMAHEINNPLSIIIQGVQMSLVRLEADNEKNIEEAVKCGTEINSIRKYLENRKIFEYMEGIKKSGIRASNIISNMLQYSRVSQTKKKPEKINLIIEKSIEIASKDYNYEKKYDFKKIKIIKLFNDDIPHVNCIETEIEQVILNILTNAYHALLEIDSDNFEPKIKITTGHDNSFATITISDNGPGVGKEMLKHIFDPFYTTKKVDSGTGLGLSISYYIINSNHSGSIIAESELNSGCKFTIKLPV
jgi:PAS domain S-box-containing protein